MHGPGWAGLGGGDDLQVCGAQLREVAVPRPFGLIEQPPVLAVLLVAGVPVDHGDENQPPRCVWQPLRDEDEPLLALAPPEHRTVERCQQGAEPEGRVERS